MEYKHTVSPPSSSWNIHIQSSPLYCEINANVVWMLANLVPISIGYNALSHSRYFYLFIYLFIYLFNKPLSNYTMSSLWAWRIDIGSLEEVHGAEDGEFVLCNVRVVC